MNTDNQSPNLMLPRVVLSTRTVVMQAVDDYLNKLGIWLFSHQLKVQHLDKFSDFTYQQFRLDQNHEKTKIIGKTNLTHQLKIGYILKASLIPIVNISPSFTWR